MIYFKNLFTYLLPVKFRNPFDWEIGKKTKTSYLHCSHRFARLSWQFYFFPSIVWLFRLPLCVLLKFATKQNQRNKNKKKKQKPKQMQIEIEIK